MKTLEEICTAVQGLAGNDVRFSLVNVRVMLRTGINLKVIKREQNANPRAVRDVLSALNDLGYALDGQGRLNG
jgi:hypothetical protein